MSHAVFKVPVTLRAITGNCNELSVPTGKVKDILRHLSRDYPALGERLAPEEKISPYMNIYLNGKDIRFLQELETEVGTNDVLTVLPTVAGGRQ